MHHLSPSGFPMGTARAKSRHGRLNSDPSQKIYAHIAGIALIKELSVYSYKGIVSLEIIF
jgi:hypothetical protein